jgi:hypothetical protein
MKSKSGYGMKKKGSVKVAGGPSFDLVDPSDVDAVSTPADQMNAKRLMMQFYQTPQGREVRKNQQRLKQRLQGA